MKEKNLDICILFDYYGALLGNNRRQAVDLYYNEDWSLAEIAEHLGISRQGVRDLIKHGEANLYEYEQKLCLVQKANKARQALTEIIGISDNAQVKALAGELLEKCL